MQTCVFHYFMSWKQGLLLTGLEPAHTLHFSSTTPQGASLSRALPTELQELVQRVGFEPTKRNGKQCEYLKYLLVAISARHHQFRHTTKPANRNSPLTTRATLLICLHYLMSRNKDNIPPVGIEPTSTRLGLVRSTTELRRRKRGREKGVSKRGGNGGLFLYF